MNLLAFDPSLRATGWAVVDIADRELLAAGCIETTPHVDRGAWALRTQHDAARRGGDLAVAVAGLVESWAPIALAVECPLGARDANAAWQLARAHQAVISALRIAARCTPPISVSSFGAKRHATGTARPEDGKKAVRDGMRRLWGPSVWDRALVGLRTKAQREAAYDAGAVALCALDQPFVMDLLPANVPGRRAM